MPLVPDARFFTAVEDLPMANPNVRKKKMRDHSHVNFMGGPSYDINNPILRLRTMAASCFFGEPQYYKDSGDKPIRRVKARHSHALDSRKIRYLNKVLGTMGEYDWRGLSPQEGMERAIDEALDHDIEETLKVAADLRQQENMRVTPQVILVRAAMHDAVKGTDLISRYSGEIIRRADEPATQLAYWIATYGENGRRGKTPIPSRLKRAWARALEGFNEYQLAKYRMENRAVKTVDVVSICHPSSDAVSKLVKGELKTSGKTWESVVSAEGSTKESWEKSFEKMGHMALLRNLRNLAEKGVDLKKVAAKLIKGAPEGKQIPFRYFSAYKELEGKVAPDLLDAVEEAMEISIGNLPHFSGRVMSLVDNSGSAHGAGPSSWSKMTIAEIGNLTGVFTAKAADEGYVGVFGDRLETVPVRKKSSTFDLLQKVNKVGYEIGGGTEHGIWLFWDQAIRNKEHWDTVFVYSDMQAGHGGLFGTDEALYRDYRFPGSEHYIDVPKLIAEYRKRVNPNVNVFLVQIAGYEDSILPECYNRTYILGGWSPSVLNFADHMINNATQQQVPAQ